VQDALPLTSEQEEAFEAIRDVVRHRRPQGFLVHGVTGAGKTHLYLAAIEEALAARRRAIVLVAEIGITAPGVPPLFGPVSGGWPSSTAASRIGSATRCGGASTAASYDVVIGPRSAVFAPCRTLA